MSEPTISGERARELLEYSSSSVQSELEQAEGWIRAGRVPDEPERWRVDAAAGAIGALANAYGRMTLWSRAVERYEAEAAALEQCMTDLVALRRRIESVPPGTREIDELRRLAGIMESIYERLRTETAEETVATDSGGRTE